MEELSAVCCLAGDWEITGPAKYNQLSVQEMIDCAKDGQGCSGGFVSDGFEYSGDHSGLCSETAYPFTGVPGACRASSCEHTCSVKDIQGVSANHRSATLQALAAQPLVIGVQADSLDFQLYVSGVLDSASCGTDINHSLFAVAYNTSKPLGYLTLLNSWGAAWGEDGSIRIFSDGAGPGTCGVYVEPLYVTVN